MWHVAQRVTTFTKSSPLVTSSQCSGVFPMDGTFLATIHPLFLSIRSLVTIQPSPSTQLMWTQNSTKCVLHKFFILYWGLPLDSSRPSTQLLKIPIGTVLVLSLTRASSVLVAQGLSKIKIRLTTDHSATGLNFCSYSPPFSYPTISDALKIVTPNCYMCVGDIERYFHTYPTAWDDRNYFCIQYKGVTWCYSKCCFGHTACPYYTSTFGAEYYRWFTHIYCIPCSYIVDDWLTAAATLARSLAQMKTISNVLESCGFTMNDAKFKSGQQIVFLGILIDSVTMTIRFDSVSAKGFRVELQVYFDILLDNKHLDINIVRPICGKLNWYAEIVQSGRIHIQSFWNYFRHHKRSYPASMIQLKKDMQWWLQLLTSWEHEDSTDLVYRILSLRRCTCQGSSLHICRSI